MILTGMSLTAVADLDILTFNALLSSVIRVTYNQRTEQAWTAMIAAQGTQKSMKAWVKGWDQARGQKTKGDITDFLKKFGGGF